MKLFCLAPSIWPTLHYEADLILQESASESGDITIVSCNKFRSDCPANKLRSRLVCSVCRLRNNDLKSYLARTITKSNINFVNFDTVKDIDPKTEFYSFFGKNQLQIYKELLKSVLSSQQTSQKSKGFKSWGYNEISKPFWNTHFNFINKAAQINNNQLIDAAYIFNGRMAGYRGVYEFLRFNDTDCFVYEHPIEEKKRVFIQKNTLVHDFENRSSLMKDFCKKFVSHDSSVKKIGKKTILGRISQDDRIGEYNFSKSSQHIKNAAHDTKEKYILITNSSEWETFGCKGSVTSFYGDQVRAIRETCRYFDNLDPTIKFILRVHPQYSFRDKRTLKSIQELSKFKNLKIIQPSDPTDTYRLMENSHFVITFYSYSGPEAVVRGKKIIALGPASYQSFKIGIFPKSKSDYYKAIQENWNTGSLRSSYSEIKEAFLFAFARRFYGKRTQFLRFYGGLSFLLDEEKGLVRLDGGLPGKVGLIVIKVLEKVLESGGRESLSSLIWSNLSNHEKLKQSIKRATR